MDVCVACPPTLKLLSPLNRLILWFRCFIKHYRLPEILFAELTILKYWKYIQKFYGFYVELLCY